MSVRRTVLSLTAVSLLLSGCAPLGDSLSTVIAPQTDEAVAAANDGYPVPVTPAAAGIPLPASGPIAAAETVAWAEPTVIAAEGIATGPYLLDTGDRLRIFVYGQPNLSRSYTVDQEGRIAVPLIGNVTARGRTTNGLQAAIKSKLGTEYVRDPQITVDVMQNRPFFILGEVKNGGQFPYVSGMTVETAVAIAGGYTERASERSFRLSRRINSSVQVSEVPGDFTLLPGDTVYVFERFF